MKYTVIPGVILTKICDEDFLVATGPARGRVPYVEGGQFHWRLLFLKNS